MSKWLVGVDEAGRGPLAGPVAVGVAVVPGNFDWASKLPGVADSKQLTEAARERVCKEAVRLRRAGELNFAVALVGPTVIDRHGITAAVQLGIDRSLTRLSLNPAECDCKLDGLLRAPEPFHKQETIIKGDATEPVIGLASIVAKVTRDRYMVRKSAEPIFAPYRFDEHKGYGTASHRAFIQQHGMSSLHRHNYCKNVFSR